VKPPVGKPGLVGCFRGCLLGLALGDALGAPFEGSRLPANILAGEFDGLIKDSPGLLRYTDDTEMTLGLVESIVEKGCVDPDDLALRFANNLDPARGYGPGTVATLDLIRSGEHWSRANRKVLAEGSFGNGAAMRAAPLGLLYAAQKKLREETFAAASVTHENPLAKEGALLISMAVSLVVQGKDKTEILQALADTCELDTYRAKFNCMKDLLEGDPPAEEVKRSLGNSVLAHESAPTAIYSFLRYGRDYLETIRFCVSLGGDTDTISAMAGAISGTLLGADGLPPGLVERLEDTKKIGDLAIALSSVGKIS